LIAKLQSLKHARAASEPNPEMLFPV